MGKQSRLRYTGLTEQERIERANKAEIERLAAEQKRKEKDVRAFLDSMAFLANQASLKRSDVV